MATHVGPASPLPLPLVSVIVATHDRAPLLSRALRSVVGQTIRDFEAIVVDDASTDDTADVAARWAAQDGRIRVTRLAERAGPAGARNHGVRCCRGEYVAVLDDDDEWLPTKLERQLPVLASDASIGLVSSAFIVVSPHGGERLAGLVGPALQRTHAQLVRDNPLAHSTVVMRRALFERAGGYNERLERLDDWELWLRLSELTRFAHLREPLARIHRTPGSLSFDRPALVQAAQVIIATYRGRGCSPAVLADLHGALGHRLMREGWVSEARALLLESLRLRPWSVRRLGLTLLALAGPSAFRRAGRLARSAQRLRGERPARSGG